jgi:hypothetical protein
MPSAEELIQSSELPLPVSKERLIAALVPRVGFSSYPWVSRGLPLGVSRFGGPADLPAAMQWPRVDGRPLLLLAQLNFAELPIERRYPLLELLPQRGWLCLFVDVEGNGQGMAGEAPGVVALQFEGTADALIRHDPEPAPGAETWTHCHAVTVCPADHHLCLPHKDAVDSPVPAGEPQEGRDAYEDLEFDVDDLARTHHEVTLLGTPKLFNPDLRGYLPNPDEWMLLLQFDGDCSWLAGVAEPDGRYLSRPTIGHADFVQYFVRKTDYAAGRLDRGFLDYMRT